MKVILSILLSFMLLATGFPMTGQAAGFPVLDQGKADSGCDAECSEGESFTKEEKQGEDIIGIPEKGNEPEEGKGTAGERKEKYENTGSQMENEEHEDEVNRGKEMIGILEKDGELEEGNTEESKKGRTKQESSKHKSGKTEDKEKEAEKITEVLGVGGRERKEELSLFENQRYAAPDVFYENKEGYFFIYVRKEGQKLEEGEWYRLSLGVDSLSANGSQKINWKMKRIGTMPLKEKDHVMTWIESVGKTDPAAPDKFSMKIEKGTAWEKSGQDDLGPDPVLGFKRKLTDELKAAGYPSPKRYYVMCGKFLYTMPGYRMYFDKSVFEDMASMDIVPENKQIQKKDKDLSGGEESWTGDGYFKFGIDTNNVGMTNYSEDRKFHHSMYGFYLRPNKYKVKYNANGGNGYANDQNAIYDKELTLRKGTDMSRSGYTLTGWNTKKDGSGKAYGLGKKTKNLTAKHQAAVTLYAQWKPNTLKVVYNANGGEVHFEEGKTDIYFFSHNWNYKTIEQDPINFYSFGLSRIGFSRKDGAEWNTKPDGTGRSFDQDKSYKMTDYAPDIKTGNREITLYAQWKPNIYTITLKHELKDPEQAGTGKLYTTSIGGIFLDSGCSTELVPKKGKISIPKKTGYKFKGYYNGTRNRRRQMIDASGILTGEQLNDLSNDQNWYAAYDYLIRCEDYADIPCDMEKADDDTREDPGIKLTYNSSTRKVSAEASQAGISVTLTGQPVGTKIGEFTSTTTVSSAAGNTGSAQNTELSIPVLEGAAYQLEVKKGDKTLCSRLVYYRDGRFRTLVKLGVQKEKEAAEGSSLSGSAWNADNKAAYDLYEYHGCSEIKDIKAPGTVYRYFRYKDVNMAYSGNGATEGRNTLEYDVSLEDMYQFRDNSFTKEKTETKYTEDKEAYECEVKYSFQGWEMKGVSKESFKEKDQRPTAGVYEIARTSKAILDRTTEDISTYQEAEPIRVVPGFGTAGLAGTDRSTQAWESYAATAPGKAHAKEYINLLAKWDACPTIVVTPGDKLEFYEGEEVTKEKLTSHLTAHDNEDNNRDYPDMNDRLRILKVVYPEPENHSQAAYEKTYETDVPEGFLLDTYYLKLTEDEEVDVLVTFAVTDSAGNITEEEIPVKVKYNHYPKISSEGIFYYLKEEANRGEITEDALLGRASAEDEEDGNITGKLGLKDFNAQVVKMQTKSKEEFSITYQVTDAYRKTTYKTVNLMVWDEDAAIAEMPKYYVRYISEKYLDTLEENSTWREPENMAYLQSILRNEAPIETWDFTHEDVLAVQAWITEGGEGNWKTGRAANREFLTKFAHCRQ